jgi:benzylsuccinate CoA-transferase BbsF subunit
MDSRAFDDVKILDFSWVLIGPLTTKYLADHGATVVRIEYSDPPDTLRLSAPYKEGKPGIDRAGYFAYVNPNKYSMSLNMRNSLSRPVIKRLIEWSDVVVSNFRPGVMERLGLGYEDIKRIKPDIIMLLLSNRGQTGPYALHGTLATTINGEAGYSLITGWPDRDPMPIPVAYLDSVSPRFAGTLLIAALIHHRKTGEGMFIDISQIETGLHLIAPLLLDSTVNNRDSTRMGNSDPYFAPHGVYRCKGEDQWCAISVCTDEQWMGFCKVMKHPSWTNEKRFSTVLGRKEHEDELNELIERITVNVDPDELVNSMLSEGVPAAVVHSAERIYNDPHLKGRNHFWKMRHKVLGQFTHLGQSFILSKTPAEHRMPAPCLGEHTEYVCCSLLGMSDAEFANLVEKGVFF